MITTRTSSAGMRLFMCAPFVAGRCARPRRVHRNGVACGWRDSNRVARVAARVSCPLWHTAVAEFLRPRLEPVRGPREHRLLVNPTARRQEMNRIRINARRAFRTVRRVGSQVGQGTVEYVALILLVALIMAGVVTAMKGYKTDQGKSLGDSVLTKIKDAVDSVQF